MQDPRIAIKAWCPGLHPRENEGDMEALRGLYDSFYDRFEGLKEDLDAVGCERVLITIDNREEFNE